MSMICPTCGMSFEQRLDCMHCGMRLVYVNPRESYTRQSARTGPSGWRHSPLGRLILGLLLSQGLFYGFRELVTGVILATQQITLEDFLVSQEGQLLLRGILIVSLVVGALFACAGQKLGLLLGVVIGATNGLLLHLLAEILGVPVSANLVVETLVQACVGAMAGWTGGQIWEPLAPATSTPLAPVRKTPSRPWKSPFAGKVAWVRVLLGTALGVIGFLMAQTLFRKLILLSGGELGTVYDVQNQLIIWEIKALALLLGGGLAGANTTNGLKQGMLVGALTTLVLASIPNQPETNWLFFLLQNSATAFPVALVGGWFGGQLLPPLIKRPKHEISMMD